MASSAPLLRDALSCAGSLTAWLRTAFTNPLAVKPLTTDREMERALSQLALNGDLPNWQLQRAVLLCDGTAPAVAGFTLLANDAEPGLRDGLDKLGRRPLGDMLEIGDRWRRGPIEVCRREHLPAELLGESDAAWIRRSSLCSRGSRLYIIEAFLDSYWRLA